MGHGNHGNDYMEWLERMGLGFKWIGKGGFFGRRLGYISLVVLGTGLYRVS
jgi:hypothetical protein